MGEFLFIEQGMHGFGMSFHPESSHTHHTIDFMVPEAWGKQASGRAPQRRITGMGSILGPSTPLHSPSTQDALLPKMQQFGQKSGQTEAF